MTDYYVRSTDGNDGDSGLTWALAKATLAGALAVATAITDTVWVSQVHAESTGANITLTCPSADGLKILCGNDGAEPPTSLATGAVVATGSNNNIIQRGSAYIKGIKFSVGSGGADGSAYFFFANSTILHNSAFFESCVFELNTTSTNSTVGLIVGNLSADAAFVRMVDCTIKFGATTQEIAPKQGKLIFQNLTIDPAGATPTNLFRGELALISDVLVKGSDLSTPAWSNVLLYRNPSQPYIELRNCKLPAGIGLITGTQIAASDGEVRIWNSDSADTNYRFASQNALGTVDIETTITRTGGATDKGTQISYKMVSSALPKFWQPLESPEFVKYNPTVGSSITVTVKTTVTTTPLQDDEIWLEVEYLGTSGFPQGSFASDRMTDILSTPADQTVEAEDWDSSPASPQDQNLVVSFTPQEVGFIHCRVMLAKPSTTVYVDPLAVIS